MPRREDERYRNLNPHKRGCTCADCAEKSFEKRRDFGQPSKISSIQGFHSILRGSEEDLSSYHSSDCSCISCSLLDKGITMEELSEELSTVSAEDLNKESNSSIFKAIKRLIKRKER